MGLEGVDIWLYYHIFWMRERLWVNYPIHKFLTNPPVFIYVSHLALWFLLILSLCRTLRGKLTPSSIFSFMNIKVISLSYCMNYCARICFSFSRIAKNSWCLKYTLLFFNFYLLLPIFIHYYLFLRIYMCLFLFIAFQKNL